MPSTADLANATVANTAVSTGSMMVSGGLIAEDGRRMYGDAARIPEGLSVADAMRLAGLDYTVVKRQQHSPGGIALKDHFYVGVEGDETVSFGPVKGRYTIAQNPDVFQVVERMAEEGVKTVAAGKIGNGRKAWMLLELPGGLKVGDEDIAPYVLAFNPHDGKGSLTFANTPIRPGCTNALPFMLRSAPQSFKVRHTGDMAAKMQQAQEALGRAHTYMEAFKETSEALLRKELNDAALKRLLEHLYPTGVVGMTDRQVASATARHEAVRTLLTDAPNLEAVRGTGWAFVNAVGEDCDWGSGRDRDRMDRLTYTSHDTKMKNRAMALVLDA